jgi:hypothetical protein
MKFGIFTMDANLGAGPPKAYIVITYTGPSGL